MYTDTRAGPRFVFPSERRGLAAAAAPSEATHLRTRVPSHGSLSPLLLARSPVLLNHLPGPSASMAEASLSVSVPACRLRTDAEIGGGIAKLKVANLRKGNIDRCADDC